MVKKIEILCEEEKIKQLMDKKNKKDAITYFIKDPTFILKNFKIDELYKLLILVNDKNFTDNFIYYIITQREDYYLFLNQNKKEKKFDTYINKYILDILYRNYTFIKNGKKDRIKNTILYGLRGEQIAKNMSAILIMAPTDIWHQFLLELPTYSMLFDYVKKNSFLIIEKVIPKERLFQYIKQMKTNGYHTIIIENEDVILSKLLGIQLNTLQEEKLLLPLRVLMKELLEKTNTKMEDIIYVNSGSYSDFYRIGNLGVKIGTKINEKIPFHARFLSPFLRRKIFKNIYLEVYKYVDTNSKIPNDELYNIYKELRESGIIWLDPREENVGKLLEDNNTNIGSERIEIEKESVGFLVKDKQQTLSKGEFVILDVDTAVYEEDFSLKYYDHLGIDLSAYKEMENRYQLENRNKKRGVL